MDSRLDLTRDPTPDSGHSSLVVDPYGNRLVLLDLSKGRYVTDDEGAVT